MVHQKPNCGNNSMKDIFSLYNNMRKNSHNKMKNDTVATDAV